MISKKKKIQIENTRNYLSSFAIDVISMQNASYDLFRYDFINSNEGTRFLSYDDAHPKRNYTGGRIDGFITVGIGFNMDAEAAKSIWKAVLPLVPFDQVYKGMRALSAGEVYNLFQECIKIKEKELKNIYKSTWNIFKLNERLAIEDMYFNAPNLVRDHTKFYEHMVAYAQTGSFSDLRKAVYEIRERSNPDRDKPNIRDGIQNRREAQILMLSTFECPEYIGKTNRNDTIDDELEDLNYVIK